MGEATPQSNTPEEVESREKYFPGEAPQEDASPREPGITREDVIEIVGETMKQVVESISPEVKQAEDVTGVNLPIEDIQLSGEKVNYRLALNPEIFFTQCEPPPQR